MNKEYMYLNNNELIVTNENGVIRKREVRGNDKNVLIAENKVENINSIITDLESDLSKQKNEYRSARIFKKLKYTLAVISFIIYILNLSTGGYTLILGCSIFSFMIGKIMKALEKNACNKINGITSKLETAQTLKEKHEKELEQEKSKSIEDMTLNVVANEIYKVEEGVDTNWMDEAILNTAYNKGYNKVLKKQKTMNR